jgi:hypothetical protein
MMIELAFHVKDKVDSVLLITESSSTIKKMQNHIPSNSYIQVVTDQAAKDPKEKNQMTWEETSDFLEKWGAAVGKKYNSKMDKNGESSQKPALLLLDDLAGAKDRFKCHFLNRVWSNFRQMGIFGVVVTQNFSQLPPVTKTTLTQVFTYRLDNITDSNIMHQSHFGTMGQPRFFYNEMIRFTGAPLLFKAELSKRVPKLSSLQLQLELAKGPKMCLVKDNRLSTSADNYSQSAFWSVADGTLFEEMWRVGNPAYFDISDMLTIQPEEKEKLDQAVREKHKAIATEEQALAALAALTVSKKPTRAAAAAARGRPKRAVASKANYEDGGNDGGEEEAENSTRPLTDADFILDE